MSPFPGYAERIFARVALNHASFSSKVRPTERVYTAPAGIPFARIHIVSEYPPSGVAVGKDTHREQWMLISTAHGSEGEAFVDGLCEADPSATQGDR